MTDDHPQASRKPQGLREQFLANTRPTPAIPALATIFGLVLMPLFVTLKQPGDPATWLLWLTAVGLIVSCGLAIAAGFCSVAPPALWLLCAVWGLSLIERAGLPTVHSYLTYTCMLAAVGMLGVQIWRVQTGRFTPTINAQE